MKKRIQYGTDRGIASKEAAKKIRILIADLTRTVHILEENQTRTLDARRRNLMDTIACLENRLGSIEHLRACKYGRAKHQLAVPGHRSYPPAHGGRFKQPPDDGPPRGPAGLTHDRFTPADFALVI